LGRPFQGKAIGATCSGIKGLERCWPGTPERHNNNLQFSCDMEGKGTVQMQKAEEHGAVSQCKQVVASSIKAFPLHLDPQSRCDLLI